MGTTVTRNFANVYMGHFEEIYVYNLEWFLIDWIPFIDDFFLVWKDDEKYLGEFIQQLNGAKNITSIKFTHEMSASTVNFLDATVAVKDGKIITDVYQKPTDTRPYLHSTLAHPPHLKDI